MYPIITISREFGSGGHSIGQSVAETLDIPFYDSAIVEQVAQESGFDKEVIEEQGEHTSRTSRLFSGFTLGAGPYMKIRRIRSTVCRQASSAVLRRTVPASLSAGARITSCRTRDISH